MTACYRIQNPDFDVLEIGQPRLARLDRPKVSTSVLVSRDCSPGMGGCTHPKYRT